MDRIKYLMADTGFKTISSEDELLKRSRFNLVIHNMPPWGTERHTDERVVIRYIHLKDTLRQFAKLHDVQRFGPIVYCEFATDEGANETHRLLNGMQIGDNIISTKLFCNS